MGRRSKIPTLLVTGFLVGSCGGGDAGEQAGSALEGTGRLTVDVTDTPFTHDLVEEARVSVDQVRAHASDSRSSGWHTIYEGAPLVMDLLDLRNGVTRTLVSLAEVPAGRYGKIRLRVEGASLRLVNGNEYSTDAGTLQLTSTATSGMQVRVDPPIEVRDGFSRTLLLDFDLAKTFHPVPANDPLSASRFQLHKGVRAANLSVSGELRGTLTSGNGQALVGDATVYVLPPGAADLEDRVASTASDANGSWAVIGLRVGSYDVLARRDDLEARASGVEVSAGSATQVDLDLE